MFRTAATKIAHNSTIPALAGNHDLRPLQDLITAEKAVLISLQKLSVDFSKASEALRTWGLNEGDDLGDILSASTTLLNHFSSALSQYATHGHVIRDQLKAIRTKEEALDELKRRRRTVQRKAEDADKKLSKMSPEHKNLAMQIETLNRLRDEIRTMDSDIMTDEAALGDFKRTTTRSCVGLKYGGLLECCEKGAIAAEFGKLLIAEISEEVTQPGLPRPMYYGHSKTENLVADAHRCVNEVTLSMIPSAAIRDRRPLEQNPVDDGYNFGQGPWSPPASKPQPPPPVQFTHSENAYPTQADTPRSPIRELPHQNPQQPSQIRTSNDILPQVMDDFGINSRAGPLDAPTSAGRFATFPTKNPGYSLQDPPKRLDSEPSFSASVAEALERRGSQDIDSSQNPSRNGSGWAPHSQSYEFTSPIQPVSGGSPLPPPPGAALPEMPRPWTDSAREGAVHTDQTTHKHNVPSPSDNNINDALLAYMTNAEIEYDSQNEDGLSKPTANQLKLGVPENEDEQHRVSRHVRWGEVEDVEGQLEKKHSFKRERQTQTPPPFLPTEDVMQLSEPTQSSNEAENLNGSPSASGDSPGTHKRVPPPVFMPDGDDEKSLNVAAAREVAKELDALKDGPSSPTDNRPNEVYEDRSLLSIPRSPYTDNGSNLPRRELSPLAPPSAPFTQRSVSPHASPEMDSLPTTPYSRQYNPGQSYMQPSFASSSPNLSDSPSPSHLHQGYSMTSQPTAVDSPSSTLPPRFQALNQSTENMTPPRFQGNYGYNHRSMSGSQIPPRFQTGGTTQVSPPVINEPDFQLDDNNFTTNLRAGSDVGSTSPYRTPPEYPRQLGTSSSFSKSNTSLNSPSPIGMPRTISAAAFKRPRNASVDNLGTSGEPVKRSLPSSPYPSRDPIASPPPTDRNINASQLGTNTTSVNVQNAETDDDQYDYINAYVNNSHPNSPSKGEFGDSVPSSVPTSGRPGGYRDGRYATDIEGSLR